MESIREQMFILMILNLFKRHNNPSLVFEWIKITCAMLKIDTNEMLRLTLQVMREEHNYNLIQTNVAIELYTCGVKINDIMNLTGKARSTCYKMIQNKPKPYVRRFTDDDDTFILKALRAFNELGGVFY